MKKLKKYNILVLTDHSRHSKENSLYALIATLSIHPQTASVMVASRGNIANNDFFQDMHTPLLHAVTATNNFKFQSDGKQFMNGTQIVDISTVDVVFLRLPRPVSDDFFKYLSFIAPQAIFVNHPEGIMATSTKAFLLNIPEVCPPMKLCQSVDAIKAFANKFPIVLKPLKEYGGKGVVKVIDDKVFDGNQVTSLRDYLTSNKNIIESEGLLAMKFLKNVSKGDKRILVVNGEILAASLRLPAENSWLCNVAQGGTSVPAEVTPEEQTIIAAISPILSQKGIVFFGADTLVNDEGKRVLSEVNTLSIGGFPQAEAQTKKPIVQMAIDNMINYINKQYQHANTKSC